MYDRSDDWAGDPHHRNGAVHYRLYLDRLNNYVIICVQDYDYLDYDATRILSSEAWDKEAEAETFLLGYLERFDQIRENVSDNLGHNLRGRLIARAIRTFLSGIMKN